MKCNIAVLDLYRQEMADWAEGKVSIFYSSQFYLEHVAYGISKGAAIQILCDHLNIPLSNTIAAGDEENDIDMIRKVSIKIRQNKSDSRFPFVVFLKKYDGRMQGEFPFYKEFSLYSSRK